MNSHELMNRHHDIEHLLLGDVAVSIQVIQGECPLKLLVGRPTKKGRKTHQHVLKNIYRLCVMGSEQ